MEKKVTKLSNQITPAQRQATPFGRRRQPCLWNRTVPCLLGSLGVELSFSIIMVPVICLFVMAHVGVANAVSVSWTGTDTGGDGINWSDSKNWSTNSIPGTDDDVSIGSGKTVTINAGAGAGTIKSLSCSGTLMAISGLTVSGTATVTTLTISGGGMAFNGTSTVDNLSMSNGSVGGSGDLTVKEPFAWTGGSVYGSGSLDFQKGMHLSGSSLKKLSGRTINNTATVTWGGSGHWEITGNGVFDNKADGIVDIQGSAILYNSATTSSATFKNAGTVKKTADGGTTQIKADVFENNGGTIQVQAGTIDFADGDAVFSGADLTVAEDASLVFSTTWIVSGTLSGSVAGTLQLAPGGAIEVATAGAIFHFTDKGFEWIGGNTLITSQDGDNPGTLTNNGVFRISGTTTGYNRRLVDVHLENQTGGEIVWSGTEWLQITGGAVLTNHGTFDIQSENNVTLYNSSSFSEGRFVNYGTFKKTIGAGTVTVNLDHFENMGGTIESQSGMLEFSDGEVKITGGTLQAANGAEVLLSTTCILSGRVAGSVGGTVEMDSGGAIEVAAGGATLALSNQGFEWSGGSSLITSEDSQNQATLSNEGILKISGTTTAHNRRITGVKIKNMGSGTITWTGTESLQITGGAILENWGILDVQCAGDISLWNSSGGSEGTFINFGFLKKTIGSGKALFSVEHIDNTNGVIDVQAGTLDLRPTRGDFLAGELKAATDSALLLSGTFFLSGTFSGAVDGRVSTGSGVIKIEHLGATLNLSGNGFDWGENGRIQSSDPEQPGTLLNKGKLRLMGDGQSIKKKLSGATLANEGTIFWLGKQPLELSDDSVLENRGNGTIEIHTDSWIDPGSSSIGVIENLGTIVKKSTPGMDVTGTTDIWIPFNNKGGTIEVEAGKVQLKCCGESTGGSAEIPGVATFKAHDGAEIVFSSVYTNKGLGRFSGGGGKRISGSTFTNQGTLIWIDSGDIDLENGGVLDNPANAVFDIQNDAEIPLSLTNPGTVKNAGTVVKTDGSGATLIGVFFNNDAGTVSVESGELGLGGGGNFINGGTLDASTGATLRFSTGTWNFAGTFTGTAPGSVEFASPGIFQMHVNGVVFNLTGSSLEWSGGTITGGQFTNKGDMQITGNTTKALGSSTVFLNDTSGQLSWQGSGNLELADEALFLNEGSFDIKTDAHIVGWDQPGSFGFRNRGQLKKTAGTGKTVIKIDLDNFDGTIQVEAGTLEAWVTNWVSGTVNVAPGATLSLTEGIHRLAGTLAGPIDGLFRCDGVKIEIQEIEYPESGGFTLKDATLTTNLTANGFDWAAGIIREGPITNKGRFSISGSKTKTLGDGTEDPAISFTNEGTLVWKDSGNLEIKESAALKNTTGTIDIQGSGKMTGAGSFENSGTVKKTLNTGTAAIEVPTTNSGTLDAQKGTLLINGGNFNGGSLKAATGATLHLQKVCTFSQSITGQVDGTVILQGKEGFGTEIETDSGTLAAGQGGATFNLSGNGLTLNMAIISGTPIENKGKLRIEGFSIFNGVTLQNSGEIVWRERGGSGVFWMNSSSVINNNTTGLFSIEPVEGDMSISKQFESSWLFTNEGTVRMKALQTTQNGSIDNFDNKGGTIEVQKGNLSVAFGQHHNGTFNLSGGGDLEFSVGIHSFTGTFTGSVDENSILFIAPQLFSAGNREVTIGASGAVFNIGGLGWAVTYRNQSDLTFKGGSLTNQGRFRIDSLDTGTLVTTSPFINVGTLEFETGLSKFTAPVTQTAGKMLLNNGNMESSQPVDIQGGTLGGKGTIKGNVILAGSLEPGLSPGILHIDGSYTQKSAGSFTLELGGSDPGTGFDQLNVTGQATLDGTLNVSLIAPFVPASGESFQVMTFGSRSGDFSVITGLDTGGRMKLKAQIGTGDLTLKNTDLACTLQPATTKLAVGDRHLIVVTLTEDDLPQSNQTVDFEIVSGPNAGKSESGVTDAAGQAAFDYTGGPATGTDLIRASGTIDERPFGCEASVEWLDVQLVFSPVTDKKIPGKEHSLTATLTKDGAPAAGITVEFLIVFGPNSGKTGTAVTGANGQAVFTYRGSYDEGQDSIVASATVDGLTISDSASVTWERREMDLSIVKAGLLGDTLIDTDTKAKPGDDVTFSLFINNNGPETATGVSLLDPWPPQLEYQSYTASTVTCTFDNVDFGCDLGDIPSGSDIKIDIHAKVKSAGNVTNEASLWYESLEQEDTNSSNDSSTVIFTVDKKKIDLSVTGSVRLGDRLVDANTVVRVGDTLGFKDLVMNKGPEAAANVVLKETFTEGFSFVSANSTKGTCAYQAANRTVVCDIGELTKNGTATIDIVQKTTRASNEACGAVIEFDENVFEDQQPNDNVSMMSLTVNRAQPAAGKGDLNADGTIDILDLILGLQIMSGEKKWDIATPGSIDVDADGKFGLAEISYIIMVMAGMIITG